MIEIFAMTWFGVIAAQLSPGPNMFAVASIALGQGRRPALFVVIGISSGMLICSLVTAIGLGAFVTAYPVSLLIMRLLGGGYLLYLAVKSALAIRKGGGGALGGSTVPLSAYRAWRRGLLVLLTNPKAFLMWAAVATFLLGHGLSPIQTLMFGPLGAISGLVVYGCYAFVFSSALAGSVYRRFAKVFEMIFAAAFGVMGASLIIVGIKEIRQ